MTDKISDCVSELLMIAKGSGQVHIAQKHIERLLDEAEKQHQHRSGRFTEAQMLRAQLKRKIQAIRLGGDPNAPVLPENMTLAELRDSIMADLERLRETGVLAERLHLPGERAQRQIRHARRKLFGRQRLVWDQMKTVA